MPTPPKGTSTQVPRRRISPAPIFVFTGLAFLVSLYIWLPYHEASLLRQALNNGDPAQLGKMIDFPSVRESVKEQIKAQITRSGIPNGKNKSSAASPSVAVISMIDLSIDLYVTPAAISALANKSSDHFSPDQGQTISPDAAADILSALNSQPVKSEGFASLTDFVIDIDAARLHLRFVGLGWKLSRIELKTELQFPSTPASPASATNSPPALITPVVDTYLEQGNASTQKGDFDGAIADYTQVVSLDPKAAVAYNNRAFARQSKSDFDGAIADYTKALELDPKMSGAFYGRGNAKNAKGDRDGAIADYTQALILDPKMAVAYFSRADAKNAKGDLDGAIADYTQTLDLDPNQASAYSNRGVVKQAKNDLDGAIADFTQALAINPKIAVAYYNRGLARQTQGNLDAAILDFNQALDLDPKMAGVYYNRGNAKNTKQDLDGAIADYTRALDLDPKIALAYSNRGQARQAKGDFNGALADYTQALALDPKNAVAYYNRGLIKEQQNDLDGAIADSSKALDLDPKDAQAYYNRGFAKLTKGNLDGAISDLREFCDLAPRDHYADHAHLYLWFIAKAQNSKTDADKELADYLQSGWNSSPDDSVTKIAGFLLNRISETDLMAAAASSDAKQDQGQHCEVWYFVGMKRLLDGDKATAIDYFHKCLATGQKDYCEYILAQAELQALEPGSHD